MPRGLRLLSKKGKKTLRPDADNPKNTSSTQTNIVGQRTTSKSDIQFDTSEESVVPRSEITFDTDPEVSEVKKESPAKQAFQEESSSKKTHTAKVLPKELPKNPIPEKSPIQKTAPPKTTKTPAPAPAIAVASAPLSLEKVMTTANPAIKEPIKQKQKPKSQPEVKVSRKPDQKSKTQIKQHVKQNPTPTSIAKHPQKLVQKKEHATASKTPKIAPTHNVDKPKSVKKNSNLKHVFAGVMIACFFLAVAFLWPYLPFNKNIIGLPGTQDSLNEMVLGESDDDLNTDELTLDENGFAVIDQIQPDPQNFEDDLELSAPEDVTQPIVVTTPPEQIEPEEQPEQQEPEQQEIEPIQEPEETTPEPTPPIVTITPEPIVYVEPTNTVGSWGLLNLNTETFDIDDEDDEVTSLYLEDVCRSVYRQNANAFDYCRETSKLKGSTAEDVGAQRCDGGGSCRVGDTCLLWNSEEEDDGDLKSYTASYLCE